MPLSPRARQIVEATAHRFPQGMSGTPVAELRALVAAGAILPVTQVHQTSDCRIPSEAGGVPVRIYRPSAEEGLPVVQWMHSGGFVIGDLDQNEEYLRRLSNAVGSVVVSVDYRLAPEHPYPAAIDDARLVWEWIKSDPAELDANVSSAALAGESAGANLSLSLSQQLKDEGRPMPSAVVSFYGTVETRISNPELSTSLLTPEDAVWFWDQYVPRSSDRERPYVSPARATDVSGLPPTLLITAEIDATRDATEAYVRRLEAAGVPVVSTRYEGMMHGFATMVASLEPAAELFETTSAFLREHLS